MLTIPLALAPSSLATAPVASFVPIEEDSELTRRESRFEEDALLPPAVGKLPSCRAPQLQDHLCGVLPAPSFGLVPLVRLLCLVGDPLEEPLGGLHVVFNPCMLIRTLCRRR